MVPRTRTHPTAPRSRQQSPAPTRFWDIGRKTKEGYGSLPVESRFVRTEDGLALQYNTKYDSSLALQNIIEQLAGLVGTILSVIKQNKRLVPNHGFISAIDFAGGHETNGTKIERTDLRCVTAVARWARLPLFRVCMRIRRVKKWKRDWCDSGIILQNAIAFVL
eukprot:jgi/Psemu1/306130/fgenesh1_kg.236_\